MSSTEGTPARRRRAHRAATPPRPRVADLESLLRDVDNLRLTLETDLTLAASAVEAGEHAFAADILGQDREALADFEARSLGRLDALAREPVEATPSRRSWVPAHAGTLVAAAAVVGLLAAVVPQAISRPDTPAPATVAAADTIEHLQDLVLHGSPNQVRAASDALHAQLASLVATAQTDPQAAANALLLLSYEQTVISRSADRNALADVLRQSEALASEIRAALPPAVRAAVPAAPAPVPQSGAAAPRPSVSPTPRPTATTTTTTSTSSTPSPKASTSGTTQPSSTASPSPSSGYSLPSPPVSP